MAFEIYPITSTEIKKAILQWIRLLVEKNYIAAYDFTLHDPYYEWKPQSIESVINGYGLSHEEPDEKFVVTPPDSATFERSSKPYNEVIFYDDSVVKQHRLLNEIAVIGEVLYDLPLNGQWSDLSASFKILQKRGLAMLELNEIHVL